MADELLDSTPSAGGDRATRSRRRQLPRLRGRFAFDETADQSQAIDDVKKDMEAGAPDGSPGLRRRRLRQDRGRHPRGVRRVDGRQAGRAPRARRRSSRSSTTARSRERFARLPVTVACSRASSRRRAARDALAGSRDGKVDVVIGTHRLLSKDVHFKDLGPARHRRGAALRRRAQGAHQAAPREVDVLDAARRRRSRARCRWRWAGCAISRVITTPPADRLPGRAPSSSARRAGHPRGGARELARGGQVFYVHNRIEAITRRRRAAARARPRGAGRRGARPDARAGARAASCSTSSTGGSTSSSDDHIVESGLDIPRANTMIIITRRLSVSRSSTSCAVGSGGQRARLLLPAHPRRESP